MRYGKSAGADVIVSCQQVLIEHPEGQECVVSWQLHPVNASPIETTEPRRSSYVSVSRLGFIVEGASHIQVAHTFDIIVRDFGTTPNDDSDLELTVFLISDIELSVERVFLVWNQIHPEPD